MITKINRKHLIALSIIHCALYISAALLASCISNDDDVPENYYASTKLTAAEFLEQRPEEFSSFIGILKRTPYFSMLSTYGTYSSAGLLKYTLFAPNNEGDRKSVV